MAFYAEKGILHERSAPYTQQQNGKAERMNRTLMEKSRAMKIAAGMPNKMWALALKCAACLHNYVPGVRHATSPVHRFSGRHPDVSRLRVFGCAAWSHVPIRTKLQDKAARGVMVGYSGPPTAGPTGNYLIMMPDGKIRVSNTVVFR